MTHSRTYTSVLQYLTQAERQTATDRQADRQTLECLSSITQTQTDRQTLRQTHDTLGYGRWFWTEQRKNATDRHTHTHTRECLNSITQTQADRQTDRHTHTRHTLVWPMILNRRTTIPQSMTGSTIHFLFIRKNKNKNIPSTNNIDSYCSSLYTVSLWTKMSRSPCTRGSRSSQCKVSCERL